MITFIRNIVKKRQEKNNNALIRAERDRCIAIGKVLLEEKLADSNMNNAFKEAIKLYSIGIESGLTADILHNSIK